jgi:hypothetical protein
MIVPSYNNDRSDDLSKHIKVYLRMGLLIMAAWGVNCDGSCRCGKADCKYPGKHPHGEFCPHGLKDASGDINVISSWIAQDPTLNLGVRTGKESGITVLDVDPRHGGLESLKALDVPDTLRAKTGGNGYHYFFQHPGVPVKSAANVFGPGLDTRGDGGYIIVAPTRHASGGTYEWMT